MNWRTSAYVCLLGCSLAVASAAPRAQRARPQPSSGLLTLDRLLDIQHPFSPAWSPDGSRVAYVSDRGGVQNLWVVEGQATTPPASRPVTSYNDGWIENLSWSRDGKSLLYVREGDLWEVAPTGGARPRAVWTTPLAESQVAFSPDGTKAAFVRGGTPGIPDWQRSEGDLWVRSLADGREVQLTRNEGVASGPSWSPDGQRIAFAITRATARSEAPAYSGAKILYGRVDHDVATPAFVSAQGGQVATLPAGPGWESAPWWLDNERLLSQRVAGDYRTRELLVTDVATKTTRTIYKEVDPKFWSLGFIAPDPAPSPDGRWVAFVSDRDGWDHAYLLSTSGGEARQLTRGRYEVRHLAWAPDSTQLAFDRSTEANPGVRHLAIARVAAAGGPTSIPVTDLTSGRGTNIDPKWSPDGGRLVYQHTDPQASAELYVTDATRSKPSVRLTGSMPPGIDRSAFIEPQRVSYRAPDGLQVPAWLFVPKGLDRSRKHPAIVWVHGDGINQNYDGWHVERNYAVYYSFHQYLLQRGYVVLAPEYRGSIGYGRDWRQDVYMDVGGKDATDAAVASDYLATLPYVDTARIGIWGLSYGGFFTLIAMTERPTAYRCGVDVAGSVDYRMWFEDPGGAWVVSRMGTPAERPAVYDKAAVVERVGRLARPLLILHGTADSNVPYIESVRLIDELLKKGKEFEFRMYPGEYHYFQRAHVVRDAWQQVERFFDKHLRPASPSAKE